MQLVKYLSALGKESIGLVEQERITPLKTSTGQYATLTDILEADDPMEAARFLLDTGARQCSVEEVRLLPPIDRQEVWAAGVTYKRSQIARMEESESSASVYDKVYLAARPELFFKATPGRVSGFGQPLRIRRDARWNVPEPELALVLNSRMQLVGFTVGNDMSSRDIEGENPLYLPQAKVYDQCCGLGPWITLVSGMPPRKKIGIHMAVIRNHEIAFEGRTGVDQMARTFEDLIGYLSRDNTFRDGAFLLTGTGIVPDESFTLQPGDTVDITIDGIGLLSNTIVQG